MTKPDICRTGEERGQIGPVCLPAPAYLRVAVVPCTGECFQRLLACFFRGGLIDGFQVAGDGFVVLPGDEPQAVAHHMHDAQLDAGFRIYRVDGVREAFQPVDTGVSQNFAPSFSASHIPSSSFWPSMLIPSARNTDLLMTRLSCRTFRTIQSR